MDGMTDSMGMSLSKLLELVMETDLACCSPWGRKESDMTEQLNRLTDGKERKDSRKHLKKQR